MGIHRAAALVLSNCLFLAHLPAEEVLRLRWAEVGPVVTGKRVTLTLKDGGRVAGTVQGMESTGLRIDVSKTSDRRTYPKGPAIVPRASISTIEMNKATGHKGLIIGGVVGGGIAAVAGGILGAQIRNEGGTSGGGPLAAAIVGPIGVGLLLGQLIDSTRRGTRRITIVSE